TLSSAPICGGPVRWMTSNTAPTTAAKPRPISSRGLRFAARLAWSIVATDRLPAVPRGQCDPGVGADKRGDEPHRPVAEQDVAPVPVFSPHLVRMAEGIIRSVDDDLRMVVGIRPTVDPNQAPGPVVFRRPGPKVEPRGCDRARNNANPGLVAQDGT